MGVCCCSLAGTSACCHCPNGGGQYVPGFYQYTPYVPQYVPTHPADKAKELEEFLDKLKKLIEEARP